MDVPQGLTLTSFWPHSRLALLGKKEATVPPNVIQSGLGSGREQKTALSFFSLSFGEEEHPQNKDFFGGKTKTLQTVTLRVAILSDFSARRLSQNFGAKLSKRVLRCVLFFLGNLLAKNSRLQCYRLRCFSFARFFNPRQTPQTLGKEGENVPPPKKKKGIPRRRRKQGNPQKKTRKGRTG